MNPPDSSLSHENAGSGWRAAMRNPSRSLIWAKWTVGGCCPCSSGPQLDDTADCATSISPATSNCATVFPGGSGAYTGSNPSSLGHGLHSLPHGGTGVRLQIGDLLLGRQAMAFQGPANEVPSIRQGCRLGRVDVGWQDTFSEIKVLLKTASMRHQQAPRVEQVLQREFCRFPIPPGTSTLPWLGFEVRSTQWPLRAD